MPRRGRSELLGDVGRRRLTLALCRAEFKLREMIKAQEKKNTSDAEGDEMK